MRTSARAAWFPDAVLAPDRSGAPGGTRPTGCRRARGTGRPPSAGPADGSGGSRGRARRCSTGRLHARRRAGSRWCRTADRRPPSVERDSRPSAAPRGPARARVLADPRGPARARIPADRGGPARAPASRRPSPGAGTAAGPLTTVAVVHGPAAVRHGDRAPAPTRTEPAREAAPPHPARGRDAPAPPARTGTSPAPAAGAGDAGPACGRPAGAGGHAGVARPGRRAVSPRPGPSGRTPAPWRPADRARSPGRRRPRTATAAR